MREQIDRFVTWTRRAESWKVAAVIAAGALVLLGVAPFVVFVALAAALYLFAVAWLREFEVLIHLEDGVFPGRNDKLIWALLLIVLPPVGVWLFRSYREARWPSAKPAVDPVAREFN